MTRIHVLRYASIGLATLGLGLGVAAADGGSISTTGPHSENSIETEHNNEANINNHNTATVTNKNHQRATSGEAEVEHNTIGGDARSGNASNHNATDTRVSINNVGPGFGNFFGGGCTSSCGSSCTGSCGGGGGSIHLTGPNSENEIETTIKNKLTVTNNNTVTVTNDNTQHARSGEASVEGNTRGGSAVSGSASNTNNTSTSVSISN
jgi:hypothetical protein